MLVQEKHYVLICKFAYCSLWKEMYLEQRALCERFTLNFPTLQIFDEAQPRDGDRGVEEWNCCARYRCR